MAVKPEKADLPVWRRVKNAEVGLVDYQTLPMEDGGFRSSMRLYATKLGLTKRFPEASVGATCIRRGTATAFANALGTDKAKVSSKEPLPSATSADKTPLYIFMGHKQSSNTLMETLYQGASVQDLSAAVLNEDTIEELGMSRHNTYLSVPLESAYPGRKVEPSTDTLQILTAQPNIPAINVGQALDADVKLRALGSLRLLEPTDLLGYSKSWRTRDKSWSASACTL